jgi:hypothetical protein
MGATLSTLRKYIRAEVGDPAPTEKMSSSTLTHDGGNGAAFFQDASYNFVTQGVIVGDVVRNITDGGSLATIQLIGNGGATNDKLTVGAIEGGTDNDYDNGDVVEIWDRHAQRGLDGTRWTDTEVEDALAQAQKIVALRFGGVEKYDIKQDIKVLTKVNLVAQTGTFQIGETISGGTNNHTAVVEYVGDDFIVISTFRTTLVVDAMVGTFESNETVTGSTNSYTARFISSSGATNMVIESPTGTFADDETLTGGSSGATAAINDAGGYSSGLFVAGETLTGATSSATGHVRATYAANNICLAQDLPTDLKHLLVAKWWDGSNWQPLFRDSIYEYTSKARSTGDPNYITIFGVDQLSTDTSPARKLWLWPNSSTKLYNELHIWYMAWDRSLSSDTDTTDFDNRVERLIVLEAAKILAGQVNEDELWQRLVGDINLINNDINSSGDNETDHVTQVIHWESGFADDGSFF